MRAAGFLLALLGALPAPATRAAATAQELNDAAGLAVFPSTGTLWDEDAVAVAARLGLPQESRTSSDASYRLYPGEDARAFGRRVYSIAMAASEGRPSSLSFILANKGDSLGQFARSAPGERPHREMGKALRDYRKAIAEDEKAVAALLVPLLGEPGQAKSAQGGKLQEKAQRWDWNGHAVLLAGVRDEYVAVRVVPPGEPDAGGDAARVSDTELKEKLKARVERRPNGDVILRDLPMVDQGPKGFCVPATMERMLRYLGIPADMYLLAVAANTQPGGGTTIRDVLFAVDGTVRRHRRKISSESARPDLDRVAKWIESGLPILWGINTSDAIDEHITAHTARRAEVADWAAWGESLKAQRRDARSLARSGDSGHVCLITGFNRATGEIALSDSWGPHSAERWITVEEAAAISQGEMAVVTW